MEMATPSNASATGEPPSNNPATPASISSRSCSSFSAAFARSTASRSPDLCSVAAIVCAPRRAHRHTRPARQRAGATAGFQLRACFFVGVEIGFQMVTPQLGFRSRNAASAAAWRLLQGLGARAQATPIGSSFCIGDFFLKKGAMPMSLLDLKSIAETGVVARATTMA